jgi:hypothetical protein
MFKSIRWNTSWQVLMIHEHQVREISGVPSPWFINVAATLGLHEDTCLQFLHVHRDSKL